MESFEDIMELGIKTSSHCVTDVNKQSLLQT